MTKKSDSLKLKLQEIGYIVYRNLFLLTNGIIFSVVGLLFVFGDYRAAIFLGTVSVLNVFFGLIQDIRAWYALKRLQLLTAPHVVRLTSDGKEESVQTDDINKGDILKIKIGDQIPCDSIIEHSHGLEVNEGLITGESDSLPRKEGEKLLAGSIVTSGSGTIKVEIVFQESRIARMTEGIKKFSTNISPIQHSVSLVVKYSGYLLVIVLGVVLVRGFLLHLPYVIIVKNVGTMSSSLVPQGLVFAVTLFFAYGAAHLFKRNVLLQEVNATEKLGRIKNLCMDKTGTLTENILTVEKLHAPAGVTKEQAESLTYAYIHGTGDASQTINAVKKYLTHTDHPEILDSQPFSSWRQYGAVHVKDNGKDAVIIAGASDVMLPHLTDAEEKAWLQEFIDKNGKAGKRILCIMRTDNSSLPKDLSETRLSIVAVYVFHNSLREGIKDSIDFFQIRGVRIRIISGDNPDTVKTVAAAAGVKFTNKVITGAELESWTLEDYDAKVKDYTIFARIVPEQKEKIITAFKKDGFTAMVGDGANDALAIKKADLGIAMFDGAPATRQLASVVLTNNSFTALPKGVELADNIIRNIEIFSSVFFNQTFIALFTFTILTILGFTYPITPLNITIINYFTVGIPGIVISLWTILPFEKVYPASSEPFLKRVLPFAAISALVQSFAAVAIFLLSPGYMQSAESNTLVVLTYSILGIIFFLFTPSVYRSKTSLIEKTQFLFMIVFDVVLFLAIYNISWLTSFFDVIPITNFADINFTYIIPIIIITGLIQYGIAKYFISKKSNKLV